MGAGNSVDTHSLIASSGVNYGMELFKIPVDFGIGVQYHMLKEGKVVKSPNLENGTTHAQGSQKIGAPEYTIGGHLVVIGVGLTTKF